MESLLPGFPFDFSYDWRAVTAKAFVLFFLYLTVNVIYQLYFSPLSKLPGPKLAAVTLWYEIYYDVFKWGRYYVKIKEMHEKYGPIVRINPFELHVSDPSFIDTLYTRSAPRDKHAYMTGQFGNPLVTFSTDDHFHHRIRRAALNPFFSKQRVLGLQDLIWTHVEKLCGRLEEFKASERLLPSGNAFGCLTADVIIEYSMGHQQNALDDPDFAPLFTQAAKKFASMGVFTKHLPWIHTVMRALPQHWIAKASPEYGAMLAFRYLNNARVREVFDRKCKAGNGDADAKISRRRTIFDDLFDSELPSEEKSLERLSQESQLIVGAALDTTAHALNTTLFHLLATPSKLAKLKAELGKTTPDRRTHTPLPLLENLPYLSAVINEGLRLSYGVSSRNARLAHSPLLYESYVIPAFTPVSMSAPFTHHDESVFPDSYTFIPERWLDSNGEFGGKTPDGRPLDRFLMSFGKGARQCAGMNLAKAEMYITLTALVRRFDFELWESSRRDVDLVHDLFLPGVDRESKGVRVLVK
ncbi:cytochrome P450 [Macroventuria anomochaeta]|uniref:Cytochrome P450 n=1 Tax=Macroventuria anomochaeta TaxID=301207 RepID=A0ACB6RUI1_9PLEO|nr:cytochrome P450 [Macroventuria anomochaeta]KAF2624794.1 cytochrome P450 [Macroventuria anomochaeta]